MVIYCRQGTWLPQSRTKPLTQTTPALRYYLEFHTVSCRRKPVLPPASRKSSKAKRGSSQLDGVHVYRCPFIPNRLMKSFHTEFRKRSETSARRRPLLDLSELTMSSENVRLGATRKVASKQYYKLNNRWHEDSDASLRIFGLSGCPV